ncbi:MAG: hypothetical protein PHD88_03535 [Firmicutes bacterium]|nr:hypothetical protein [Bacillota bacterium]MDD4262930.1 hypothetical protein [Bacillota bacterium]MDD4693462.1 hypothetical protein [Bacillota bacterium]
MLRGLEDEAVRLISDFIETRKGVDASIGDLSEDQKEELLDLLQWELGVLLETESYDELLYGDMGLDNILNAFYDGIPIQ